MAFASPLGHFSRWTFSSTSRRARTRELRDKFCFDGRRFAKQPPPALSSSRSHPRSPYASRARSATARLLNAFAAASVLVWLLTWLHSCACFTRSSHSRLSIMIGSPQSFARARNAALPPLAEEASHAPLPPGLSHVAVAGAPSPSPNASPHAHAFGAPLPRGAPPPALQPMDVVHPDLPTTAFADRVAPLRVTSTAASTC